MTPRTPPQGEPKENDDATQNGANNTEENAESNLRRSERNNKGVGPERYDSHFQKELNKNRPEKSKSRVSTKESLISRRSSGPPSTKSRNSESSSIRASKQLEIELKRQEDLANLERQQIERERQIIELRARLEEAILFEKTEYNGCSKASSVSEHSVQAASLNHSKVVNWLKKKNYDEKTSHVGDFRTRLISDKTRPRENREPSRDPPIRNTYMARQAIGKDLPNFKGSTADWILFERMFYQTTEACGFSSTENMLRLQKCLQGEALEAVRALLMTTNVDRVMDVLRRRFGRAEHIIEDIINKVTNSPNVRDDRPITMIRFAENVTNLVATIESLNQWSYLSNPMLVRQLVNKLPAVERMSWGKRTVKGKDGASLAEFAKWINEEAEAASVIYQPPPPEKEKNEKRVYSCHDDDNQEHGKCNFCGSKTHLTDACGGYKKLSVDDRWEWVKKKRVCFGCLSAEHNIRQCKRGQCKQSGCMLRHHPTLHNNFLQKQKERNNEKTKSVCETETNEKSVEETAERVNCTRKDVKRVYLRVLPVTLTGPEREINTYALLDGGSTVSLISDEIAQKLGLKGPRRPLVATWYDDTTNEDNASRQVSLEIRGMSGKTFCINDARTTKMKMPGQSMKVDLEKWPHLNDLDIPDLENAIPTIMIGEDNLHLKKVIKQITGRVGTPFATLTPLGWMVHGPDDNLRAQKEVTLFVRHSNKEEELNELVRDFWTTESFGVSPSGKILSSTEDQRARDVLNKTLKRGKDRWEVGLLWKTDQEILPESRESAKKRLISIEKKMARDPEFGKKYSANIQAYLDKGYARRLTDEQEKTETDTTWYLPHFSVYNPQKPEKLRMVFDAASRSHGLCLNDRLLKGPDLLNPLPGLLFKFREKKIAICGDLREMFHQVRIREQDCSSQRFLWRDEETKRIITLEMTVMIFGAISSPFVALEVKNRNAEDFKETYPETYDAIVKKHYMDDYLDSLDNVQDAVRRIREVIYVHKKGGFEMRNLMTNSPEVRDALNPDLLATTGKDLTLLKEDCTRVLGVNWTPETDSFLFSTKFPKLDKKLMTGETTPTKRQILKILMSVFDPLGLVAPLTIRAKILLQEIWKEGTSWDQEVTKEIEKIWNEWLSDLHHTEDLRIPRHYADNIARPTDVQLHVFCDASVEAFAAAAYLRLQGEDFVKTTLVMAKTRVAPIKLLTVPRLELQSAVMAARLAAFVQQEHSLHFNKIVFWSDSQTALAWIRSDARKFQPFVAHRIAEILDITSPTDWRWVPTLENVADDATRSRGQDRLISSSRWFHGPDFLRRPENEWPLPKTQDGQPKELIREMKKEYCCVITVETPVLNSSRFSSWTKMIRVVAWVLRFADRCKRRKNDLTTWELTGAEFQRAEDRLLQQSQKEAFPEEWQTLQSKKEVSSTSKILTLSPILKDGLIRMDGRVVNRDGTAF